MLVLDVEAGEEVVIGEGIIVTHFVRHGRWKIGVTAPRDVPVVRKEVLDRENDDRAV